MRRIPRNTTLVDVVLAQDFEFVAFNPGDWIFHCHMVKHMMNHMVPQVRPRIRRRFDVSQYMASLPNRPSVQSFLEEPAFLVPSYPQKMQGMEMKTDNAGMMKISQRREARGIRAEWFNLETVVGSQKSTQALGAPRTIKKCLTR